LCFFITASLCDVTAWGVAVIQLILKLP